LIDIDIEDAAWTGAEPEVGAMARAAAEAVLAQQDRAGEGLNILLADDRAVAQLNGQFRGRTGPTNVLSFPAARNPEDHLGDVALAFGVCAREAREQGKTLGAHLQHLVAHGVLHLLGYDHMSEDEAQVMEGLERSVLAGLGIADPYAAGEGEHD
jgi:probable rRNA maturation factor